MVYHDIAPRKAEVSEEMGLGVNQRYNVRLAGLLLADRKCRDLQLPYHRGVLRPPDGPCISYIDSVLFCLKYLFECKGAGECIRIRICVYYDADIFHTVAYFPQAFKLLMRVIICLHVSIYRCHQ